MENLKKLVLFGVLLFCSQTLSFTYELSLQKYGKERQKTLCAIQFEEFFPSPNSVFNYNSVCGSSAALELSHKLHMTEFKHRFAFKSQEATRLFLNRASLLLSAHEHFQGKWLSSKKLCLEDFNLNCLKNDYLIKKEAESLMTDYSRFLLEAFENSSSCSADDLRKYGCKNITVTDPYLAPTDTIGLFSVTDLEFLNSAYKKIKEARKILAEQTGTKIQGPFAP